MSQVVKRFPFLPRSPPDIVLCMEQELQRRCSHPGWVANVCWGLVSSRGLSLCLPQTLHSHMHLSQPAVHARQWSWRRVPHLVLLLYWILSYFFFHQHLPDFSLCSWMISWERIPGESRLDLATMNKCFGIQLEVKLLNTNTHTLKPTPHSRKSSVSGIRIWYYSVIKHFFSGFSQQRTPSWSFQVSINYCPFKNYL